MATKDNKDKDKMADAKAVDSLLASDEVPSKAETDAKAAKMLDEVGEDGKSLAVKLNEISEKTRTGHGLEREDFDALDVAKTVFDADERRQANAVANANKVVDAVTAVMSNRGAVEKSAAKVDAPKDSIEALAGSSDATSRNWRAGDDNEQAVTPGIPTPMPVVIVDKKDEPLKK